VVPGQPRISVVTPSYNQASYIEETLRSILLQDYPDLEVIVIDGASTDGSRSIIQRYGRWLTHWSSEPDNGQAAAINKGFAQATGQLFAWLNSDDLYHPGALHAVAAAFSTQPDTMVAGEVLNVRQTNLGVRPVSVVHQRGITLENLVLLNEEFAYAQPGLFFPAAVWEEVGGLDERLHYAMDHDLLCRMVQRTAVSYIPDMIAQFRIHSESKTASQWLPMLYEQVGVAARYAQQNGMFDRHRLQTHMIRAMVRQAGNDVFERRIADGAKLLATAASKDAAETAWQLTTQFVAGVRRHAITARPSYRS
jgi:glycosyltransferase involved in cell wall biosynthesis